MRGFRFYKILSTLMRYGLDDMIPRRWLPWYVRLARRSAFWLRNRHRDKSLGQRLRMALEELGPVYVKLGQMLSTRQDLLDPEMILQLSMLQDRVPPFPGKQAQALIEEALELNSIDEVFSDFAIQPLASASIAQVHTATLKHPEPVEVVIKVLRPGINKTIDADLELMESVARLAARYLPDGRRLKPVEVIKEYRKTLYNELSLDREAANAIQLRRNFTDSELLYIPEVFSAYTRANVMVMERIYGIPVNDVERLKAHSIDLKVLAERGVEVFFTQVFRDSFFHADMHPGNIFVDPDSGVSPRYFAVDFGIVGTLNREDKRYLAANFIAFFNRDYRKVAELHIDSGWVPDHVNVEEFESAIRTVCEPIFEKPLADISFAHVLLNLFNTARRFEMEVQPQLVLLQKTLLYVEGLGRQLYPQLDLWKTAKPYLERWMQEQIGWRALLRNVKEQAPYWAEKLPEMPGLLYDTLQQMQKGGRKQREWAQQFLQHQRKAAVSRWWSLLAASLSVSAAAFVVADVQPWLTIPVAAGALLSWLQAWWSRP
ncbi:MAG: ubiquinone biosynthesis regulatory protein kinase UbiB [Aliidiomarina sp.]|uniref:ubiquinone biosynthesis regulatory protein kinase UbiB n=1 Tax=Aliidiomarina sp. TaxID=1872439 RepID=UPI0025C370E0|nr:ubiquinone biosynthesis regulatory protein kinase UbiB [Aliidiomarina sp.]MCH8500871.1 ubiquinone biosynthesis regulatory protein kinase UbiB [Aliidiomarina sp.]